MNWQKSIFLENNEFMNKSWEFIIAEINFRVLMNQFHWEEFELTQICNEDKCVNVYLE